jgi:hypothetical protein
MVTRPQAADPDEVRPDDRKGGARLAQDNNTPTGNQQLNDQHACLALTSPWYGATAQAGDKSHSEDKDILRE